MELQPTIKPLQSEIDAVRTEAIKRGRSPDDAEAVFRKKLEAANKKIKETLGDESNRLTGEFFSKNKLN